MLREGNRNDSDTGETDSPAKDNEAGKRVTSD
jgi:hypothetical protein